MVKPEDKLSTHSKILLAELDNFRQNDKFVDVTLIVEGVHMKAHRVVLAACSKYFSAMFLCSMNESKQFDIVMHVVSAEGMKMLLEYFYTSKLPLDNYNIQEVLSAAIYIQINEVVAVCITYIKDHVNFENFTNVLFLADVYQLKELREEVCRFLCSRFKELSTTSEFQNLPCEQLNYALQSNFAVDCTEDTIVEIVSDYCLTHNVSTKSIDEMFAGIRLKQMYSIDLKILPNFNRLASSDYAPPLLRKIYHHLKTIAINDKKQDFLLGKNAVFNTRGMTLALIIISGVCGGVVNSQINLYFPNQNKWSRLMSAVNYCRAAVIGHEILFFAGATKMNKSKPRTTCYEHGVKYNVLTNKWTKYAKEPTPRTAFSSHTVGKYLYFIGGESTVSVKGVKSSYVRYCERYNSVTDEWNNIAPLTGPRSHHSGTIYKLFLYISGGIIRSNILNTCSCYDILQDSWHQKKPMLKRRANHVLVTIDDQIYACGGWFWNNNTHVLVPEIEVYDIEADTWQLETIIPEPSFYTGITAFERKIYFVGGRFPEGKTHMGNKMQIYDVVSKEWSTRTMPESKTTRCYCTTIYVPLEKSE